MVQCCGPEDKIIDIKDDGHKNMFYLTDQNDLYCHKHKKSHFHKTRGIYRTSYSNVKLFDIIGSKYYSIIAIIYVASNSLHLIYDGYVGKVESTCPMNAVKQLFILSDTLLILHECGTVCVYTMGDLGQKFVIMSNALKIHKVRVVLHLINLVVRYLCLTIISICIKVMAILRKNVWISM